MAESTDKPVENVNVSSFADSRLSDDEIAAQARVALEGGEKVKFLTQAVIDARDNFVNNADRYVQALEDEARKRDEAPDNTEAED